MYTKDYNINIYNRSKQRRFKKNSTNVIRITNKNNKIVFIFLRIYSIAYIQRGQIVNNSHNKEFFLQRSVVNIDLL